MPSWRPLSARLISDSFKWQGTIKATSLCGNFKPESLSLDEICLLCIIVLVQERSKPGKLCWIAPLGLDGGSPTLPSV